MPVGQQRQHPAALGGGVVKHDGSRIGDPARGRGNHALGLLDLRGRQVRGRSSIRSPRPATFGRQSRRGQRRCACRWLQVARRSWLASSSGVHSTTSASYSRSRSIIRATQASAAEPATRGYSRAARPHKRRQVRRGLWRQSALRARTRSRIFCLEPCPLAEARSFRLLLPRRPPAMKGLAGKAAQVARLGPFAPTLGSE